MSIINSPIMDSLSLVNQLRDYEPGIVKIIFDFVFVPCYEDKEIHKYIRVIPKPGTTYIGEQTFRGNKKLEMVIIDKSVKSIGNCAFGECLSLTVVSIPNSVETISNYAFAWCSSLTVVNIPNSIRTIGDYAFSGCKKLTILSIPNSIKTIGRYAFHR